MAAISYNQLLSSPVVTRAISQIKTPQSRLVSEFGANPGGRNVNQVGGHYAGYDIFNKNRRIATGRAPGSGPATVAPQTLGHVPVTLYRAHEKTYLLQEKLFKTRGVGKGWGTIESRGQSYLAKQQAHIAQAFNNSREFMVSRMLRGGFDLLQSGDDWIPVESGSGTFTIDFQIPSTSKSQLAQRCGSDTTAGPVIDRSWSIVGAADISNQMLMLNQAFEYLHGLPLRHAWCNTTILGYLLNNVGLINMGGTANTSFAEYRRNGFTGPDGTPDTGFEVVFKGIPWLTFHVYDAGLLVNGTYTKFFGDTQCVFTPDISNDWFEMYEGSEIVAENVMDEGTERFGIAAWTERCTQPAGFELIAVDNCLPVLYRPTCVADATVVF